MINIHVNPLFDGKFSFDILIRAAEAALQSASQNTNQQLTIVVDTDETLQELNRQYLGIDSPTDVLSFASDEFDPDDQVQYIGDVVISFNRAELQAAQAGHALQDELQLLVVHGVLHLLGFDHAEPDQKAVMWSVQDSILNSLGCHINQLPE